MSRNITKMKEFVVLFIFVATLILDCQGLPMNANLLRRQERGADDEEAPGIPDSSSPGEPGLAGNDQPPMIPQPPEQAESEGAFQSDIMLTDEQWAALQEMIDNEHDDDDHEEKKRRKKRKAVAFLNSRWPQKTVPYEITTSSAPDVEVIHQAIQHWADNTCIKFQPYTPNQSTGPLGHDSRISFVNDPRGCWSYLGRAFSRAQPISIGNGCAQMGTVAHEIGHAIGFHHEQSRPDRDNYITIHEDNIIDGYENNFIKYSFNEVTTHEVPYDVGSLMHYGSHYFSKNNLPTITTKDPSKFNELGNRDALTFYDIKLANIIYNCNEDCTSDMICLNGGYQGPSCGCVCPPGFSGTFCQVVGEPEGPVNPGGCSYTFTDAVGEITSVNYPGNYRDMMDCTYRVQGGPGATITLIFRDFDLEYHQTCSYDYLNVRPGDEAGAGSLGSTFCGSQIPPVQFTQSNEMVLTFHSDQFVNGRGFRITYIINGPLVGEEVIMTTEAPTTTMMTTTMAPTTTEEAGEFVGTCGGYFGALTGNLASPNYPAAYSNNQVCLYTIQVPSGRRVELTFHHFDLEYKPVCTSDYVSISLGLGVQVPMKLCGSSTPTGTFISLENRIQIIFRADAFNSGAGFAASYQTIDL